MAVTPGQIVCDTAVSDVSTRPIRNSVITDAVQTVEAGMVTVDDALDDVSTNPVENQAIKAAIDAVTAAIPSVDAVMSPTSTNPVQNKVIQAALAAIPGATLISDIANLNSATLQAVQGRVVKEYTDRSSQVKSYDRIVSTAGELAAACTALSTQGYGTLWINGRIVLPSAPTPDTHFRLNGAISLRGLSSQACIHRDPNSTSLAIGLAQSGESGGPFRSGATYGRHVGSVLSTDLNRGQGIITATGLNADVGDWILLFSDSEVPETEIPWHSATTPLHPAEMHMVRAIEGTDVYRLDNAVYDNYLTRTGPAFTVAANVFTSAGHGFTNTLQLWFSPDNGNLSSSTGYYVINATTDTFQLSLTSGGAAITTTTTSGDVVYKPRAWVVPMRQSVEAESSNVIIDNLLFTSSDDNHYCASIYYLDGLEITNCRFGIENEGRPSAQLDFNYCANVDIHGNVFEGSRQVPDEGYCLVPKVVTNFRVRNNVARGIRHFITTGGQGVSSGSVNGATNFPRWGGPINTIIESNIVHHYPHTDGGAQPAIDAHAEGYGIVIQNNLVLAGEADPKIGIGIGNRARKTVIKNNVVLSNGRGHCIRTSVRETTIVGNVCIAGNSGISVTILSTTYTADTIQCIIKDNICIGVSASSSSAPLYISNGGENVIEGNLMMNSLGNGLLVLRGSGNVFINNTFVNNGATGGFAACVWFGGTGADSAADTLLIDNKFIGYRVGLSVLNDVIAFTGTGDNNQLIDNKFIDCNAANFIRFVGGTGHRVSDNKAWKQANTNFIALGTTIDDTDIKIIGNTADGYGAGSLGLSGTNAAAVTATYDSKNWID
jgi:parallel beta-helix repeat protein